MRTRIARWGNSNAVRLPADLMIEAGLAPGAEVRLVKAGRGLLIEPAIPHYTLDQLLSKMTPRNTPAEVDWGRPIGLEVVE